ncbi:hypothetical protein Tco_1063083 [Tanacetum coccineum]
MYAHSFPSRKLHNQQHQAPPPVVEQFNLEEPIENPDPLAPMDDNRTMAQLLEAPTAELHQLDTFYNALNSNDQDSLNPAAILEPEVTMDKRCPPTNNRSTEDVQPPVDPLSIHESITETRKSPEKIDFEISFTMPDAYPKFRLDTLKPYRKQSTLAFCSRDIEKKKDKFEVTVPSTPSTFDSREELTSRALIDVYEGEITLRVGREAITFNLD